MHVSGSACSLSDSVAKLAHSGACAQRMTIAPLRGCFSNASAFAHCSAVECVRCSARRVLVEPLCLSGHMWNEQSYGVLIASFPSWPNFDSHGLADESMGERRSSAPLRVSNAVVQCTVSSFQASPDSPEASSTSFRIRSAVKLLGRLAQAKPSQVYEISCK